MNGALKLIVTACVAICSATTYGVTAHQQMAISSVAWQQSQSVSVRLSVKGHEVASPSVEAECFVEGPPPVNLRSRRRVLIEREKEHTLYFPDDFHRRILPGEYRWGCVVDERTIARGRFEYVTELQARIIP